MTDVAPTVLDRLWRSFRDLVRAELPFLTFYGRWEYVVQGVGQGTVDVVPASSDVPLPSMVGIPLSPSIDCAQVTLVVGSRCTVAFKNGDPSRPEVVAGDAGEVPTAIAFAGGGPKAARVNDTVTVSYLVKGGPSAVAPITPGSLIATYDGTSAGLVSATADAAARNAAVAGSAVVQSVIGTINSGSSIVTIGG